MYFLREEVGNARESSFNLLPVIGFQADLMWLIFPVAIGFAADVYFYFITFIKEVL